MDRRRALKAIAVLPFGWAGLLGALPNRQPQTQPVDVPFSLQLAPHNLSAHLQRPVPLAVTLTNLTKASVGIRVPFTDETSHIFYQFLITDIAGHPVSNRVKTIYYRDALGILPDSNSNWIKLGPGGAETESLDLSRRFKFLEPGQYRIRVTRSVKDLDANGPRIQSNTVVLTLLP